jgi:hypothetical protein
VCLSVRSREREREIESERKREEKAVIWNNLAEERERERW